jgi:hypothetical protein
VSALHINATLTFIKYRTANSQNCEFEDVEVSFTPDLLIAIAIEAPSEGVEG